MSKIQKIFVDYPNILNTSNGTKCIRDLIFFFDQNNIEIKKIYRKDSYIHKLKNYFFNLTNYYGEFSKKYSLNQGDWLIACDTTSIYLLNFARSKKVNIIWWQLAPYNFLGNKQLPKAGEYNLPFSSYTDPKANFFFYYQPRLDNEWKVELKNSKVRKKRKFKKICFYTGKGRLTKLPKNIRELFLDYESVFITRTNPKSRKEYFHILGNSDGLISFDEMTQTNLEAASLGLPVFIANPIFPKKCLSNFTIHKLQKRITHSPHKFVEMIKSKEFPSTPFEEKYLEFHNEQTFKYFAEIFDKNRTLKKLKKKDVEYMKEYSKFLLSKKAIYPFINSGQSPSSLLINLYVKNLIYRKKYQCIIILSKVLDKIGLYLHLLGLIRIIEVLILKLLRIPKKINNYLQYKN